MAKTGDFAQHLGDFLSYLEITKNRSKKTIENYDFYLRRFAALLHINAIASITPDGVKIDALFTEIIELILQAGYSAKPQKLPVVLRASMKLDALKYFLQTSWEMKMIDNKKHVRLSGPLVVIGKMLGGWRKQLQNEAPPE